MSTDAPIDGSALDKSGGASLAKTLGFSPADLATASKIAVFTFEGAPIHGVLDPDPVPTVGTDVLIGGVSYHTVSVQVKYPDKADPSGPSIIYVDLVL